MSSLSNFSIHHQRAEIFIIAAITCWWFEICFKIKIYALKLPENAYTIYWARIWHQCSRKASQFSFWSMHKQFYLGGITVPFKVGLDMFVLRVPPTRGQANSKLQPTSSADWRPEIALQWCQMAKRKLHMDLGQKFQEKQSNFNHFNNSFYIINKHYHKGHSEFF